MNLRLKVVGLTTVLFLCPVTQAADESPYNKPQAN